MGKKAHRGKRKGKREIREERQKEQHELLQNSAITAGSDVNSGYRHIDGTMPDLASMLVNSQLPTYEETLKGGIIGNMIMGSSGDITIADFQGNTDTRMSSAGGVTSSAGKKQPPLGGPGGDWQAQNSTGKRVGEGRDGSISAPLKISPRLKDTGTQLTFSSTSLIDCKNRDMVPRTCCDSSDTDAEPTGNKDEDSLTDGPQSSFSSHTHSSDPLSSDEQHQQPVKDDSPKKRDLLDEHCEGCSDCGLMMKYKEASDQTDDDDEDWETQDVGVEKYSDDTSSSSCAGSWKNPGTLACSATGTKKQDESGKQNQQKNYTASVAQQKGKQHQQQLKQKRKPVIRNVIQAKMVGGKRQRRISKSVINNSRKSSEVSNKSTSVVKGLVPVNLRLQSKVTLQQHAMQQQPAEEEKVKEYHPQSKPASSSSSGENKSMEPPAASKATKKRKKKKAKLENKSEMLPTIVEESVTPPEIGIAEKKEDAPKKNEKQQREPKLSLGGFQLKPKPGEVLKRPFPKSRSPSPPCSSATPAASPSQKPPTPPPQPETPNLPSPLQQPHQMMLQQQFFQQQQQLMHHQQMLQMLQQGTHYQMLQNQQGQQLTSPAILKPGEKQQPEKNKLNDQKTPADKTSTPSKKGPGTNSTAPSNAATMQQQPNANMSMAGFNGNYFMPPGSFGQTPPQFAPPMLNQAMQPPEAGPASSNQQGPQQQQGGQQQPGPMTPPGIFMPPYPPGMLTGHLYPPGFIPPPPAPLKVLPNTTNMPKAKGRQGKKSQSKTGDKKKQLMKEQVMEEKAALQTGQQQPPGAATLNASMAYNLQYQQMQHQAAMNQHLWMQHQQRLMAAHQGQSGLSPQQQQQLQQQPAGFMMSPTPPMVPPTPGQMVMPGQQNPYWPSPPHPSRTPMPMVPSQQPGAPSAATEHDIPPPLTSRDIFKHAENYLEVLADHSLKKDVRALEKDKSLQHQKWRVEQHLLQQQQQKQNKEGKNKKSKGAAGNNNKGPAPNQSSQAGFGTIMEGSGNTIIRLPDMASMSCGGPYYQQPPFNDDPAKNEAEYQKALQGPHVEIEMLGNEIKATIKNVGTPTSNTKGQGQQKVMQRKQLLKLGNKLQEGQSLVPAGQSTASPSSPESGPHKCYQPSPMESAHVTQCLRGERLVRFNPLREAILKLAADEDQPVYHYTRKVLLCAATQRVSAWRRKKEIGNLCFGAPLDALTKQRALDAKCLLGSKQLTLGQNKSPGGAIHQDKLLSNVYKDDCKNCFKNVERGKRRNREVGLALNITIIKDLKEWAKYYNNPDDLSAKSNLFAELCADSSGGSAFQVSRTGDLQYLDQPQDDYTMGDRLRSYYTVQDLLVLLWHRETERLYMIEQQLLCTVDIFAKGHAIVYEALYHDFRFKVEGVRFQFAMDVLYGFKTAVDGLLVIKSQMDILESSYNSLGADMSAVFDPIFEDERRLRYFVKQRERINLMMMAKAARQPMSRFGIKHDNHGKASLAQRLAIVEDVIGILERKLGRNVSLIAQLYRKVLNLSYYTTYYASEASELRNTRLLPCTANKDELMEAFEKELSAHYKVIRQKMSVTPGFDVVLKNPAGAWKAAVLQDLEENFKEDLIRSLYKYVPEKKKGNHNQMVPRGFPFLCEELHDDMRTGKWCDIPDGPTCVVS